MGVIILSIHGCYCWASSSSPSMVDAGPRGDEIIHGDGALPPNSSPLLSSIVATKEEKKIRRRRERLRGVGGATHQWPLESESTPSDMLLLVVGPLTMASACPHKALSRRGGASGCVHGRSGRHHGRCNIGSPSPSSSKEGGGRWKGGGL